MARLRTTLNPSKRDSSVCILIINVTPTLTLIIDYRGDIEHYAATIEWILYFQNHPIKSRSSPNHEELRRRWIIARWILLVCPAFSQKLRHESHWLCWHRSWKQVNGRIYYRFSLYAYSFQQELYSRPTSRSFLLWPSDQFSSSNCPHKYTTDFQIASQWYGSFSLPDMRFKFNTLRVPINLIH